MRRTENLSSGEIEKREGNMEETREIEKEEYVLSTCVKEVFIFLSHSHLLALLV